jgi:regulator of replication initiation timing
MEIVVVFLCGALATFLYLCMKYKKEVTFLRAEKSCLSDFLEGYEVMLSASHAEQDVYMIDLSETKERLRELVEENSRLRVSADESNRLFLELERERERSRNMQSQIDRLTGDRMALLQQNFEFRKELGDEE